ncbi:head-tail connector protein [Burkholderia anthina]|uniref:head-tail connector protein n=1 Tax=Burkholderia anthina TaxID=179879 RepID=UPI001AA038F8|nr:phage head-tail connector protein [Burkholderia anthina]QTD91764.1 phage head-tail connector protein [Burkholderia anthina]
MTVKVIGPPAQEAISLADACLHLRADQGPENTLIERAIRAARRRAETEIGRPLLPQTCEKQFEKFDRRMYLWRDVTEVVSVNYADESGVVHELDSMSFYVSGRSDLRIVIQPPVAREVVVQFKCGAFEADSVPDDVVDWMLLQVGAIYENRSPVDSVQTYEIPGRFVDGLLDGARIWSI